MQLTCDFCYHHCKLEIGQKGICKTRINDGAKLATIGYGHVLGLSADMIEKKPLYHFMPGSHTLSFALHGCNFACEFCQNYQLSQEQYRAMHPAMEMAPKELIDLAVKKGYPSISYTYSEPLVWQDCMIEVAQLAHQNGLKNVMVTNGSFSEEALNRLDDLIDAYNIDVKGDEEFYRTVCKGSLKPVLAGLAHLAHTKAHIEVTTMLIEGIHTQAMVDYLAGELKECGVQVWHLSRFFPKYHFMDRAPTSERFLDEMYAIANQGDIPYVYRGNSASKEETLCPVCHHLLLGRDQYGRGIDVRVEKGSCPVCNHPVYGVYE